MKTKMINKLKSNFKTIVMIMLVGNLNASAQDTIVMKNESFIIAKILEISSTEVKFIKYDNTDGPTYIHKLSDISKIKYQNGLVENFFAKESDNIKTETTMVKKEERPLFLNENFLSEYEKQEYMKGKNNPDINRYVHKTKVSKGLQNIGFLAIPLGVLSMYHIGSYFIPDYGDTKSQQYHLNTAGVFAGLAAVVVSGSIYFKIDRTIQNKKAIELYNELY